MGIQPLGLGQGHGGGRDGGKTFPVATDQGSAFQKVEHAQARGEPGAACRRQNVVGPGHVVADGLRREPAEEYGTGIAYGGRQGFRLFHRKLQVLGRDAIDQWTRIGQGFHEDDGTEGFPALCRDPGPGQDAQVGLDRFRHGFGEVLIIGHQDRLRGYVMFGLCQQVGGNPGGVVKAVSDNQYLRRTGDHVYADDSKYLPLGRCDVDIPGTDDLVHPSDGRGAKGQRSHGLGAADPVDFVHAGNVCRRQHQRIDLAARRRHHHDHPLHSRYLGRYGIHQHRRGIGRRAAGNVQADRGKRLPAETEAKPGPVGVIQVLGHLPAVKVGDPVPCQLQRLNGLR